MTMKSAVSRQVALQRQSAPDQLDLPVQVVRAADWLVFLPLSGLLALVLAWGWFGSVPTKVSGRCILLNPSGLVDVSAAAAGRLTELNVQVGDVVRRGQAVGTIALPELSDQIGVVRAQLDELQARRARVRSYADRGQQLNAGLIEQQRELLQAQQRAAAERLALLREREEAQAQLLAQGMITRLTWITARQELNAASGELATIAAQLSQLDLKRLDGDKQRDTELAAIDAQIEDRRRQLDTLQRSQRATTVVESPFGGRVVELKAAVGVPLATGAPVLTIEQDLQPGQPLEAAILVPAGDGKRVSASMPAEVTPATVKREESGYLRATVRYVAEYPSTQQRLQLLLQNDAVVRELAGASPPIEIRAVLQPADNRSGYAWSTPRGAPVAVRGGTLCHADIVVDRQRPASLVMPLLRKTLGVD